MLIENGILAQSVEHLTFNQVVRGSNPRCLIRLLGFTWKLFFSQVSKNLDSQGFWNLGFFYLCGSLLILQFKI